MTVRVMRYADRDDLAQHVAGRLLSALIDLQSKQYLAQLCLSGGRTANAVYKALGDRVKGSTMDPGRLELWWSDERYLPTESADRHVGRALALLGGAFPLDPGRTHPMPSLTEHVDVSEAALGYADELGQTKFDICILAIGPSGHIASLSPQDPAALHATSAVIGVAEWPTAPAERLSITLPVINRSREVWILAAGSDKADAVAGALVLGRGPAAMAHGTLRTLWFVDADAAAQLPYYRCPW